MLSSYHPEAHREQINGQTDGQQHGNERRRYISHKTVKNCVEGYKSQCMLC